MAVTKLADIIVPEVFEPYVIKRTMELSALFSSGIVANDSEFDRLASGGSETVQMPFWNDLTGNSATIVEDATLTPDNITSARDVARIQGRVKSWGANGLTALLSGDDPLAAIGDLVAGFWARDMQDTLLYSLAGVFSIASMAGLVHDISGEALAVDNLIGPETTVDACQLLGDAKGNLTAMAMNSAVEAYLSKEKFLTYETGVGGEGDRVAMYMGKRVVVDDALPYNSGTKIATTYLFGPGAFAYGNGSNPRIQATEVQRALLSAAGEDYLINRKLFVLHPRGVKWLEGNVAASFPTNAELALAANWLRVYEAKALRLVAFKHKIG
jgi:hypothetical protein